MYCNDSYRLLFQWCFIRAQQKPSISKLFIKLYMARGDVSQGTATPNPVKLTIMVTTKLLMVVGSYTYLGSCEYLGQTM